MSRHPKLSYGPVKILKGTLKGRIGFLDDVDGKYGFVYLGRMVENLDAGYQIPLSYLTNEISAYYLSERANNIRYTLAQQRARRQTNTQNINDDDLIELYGEYVYILEMLNEIYINTHYLNCSGNKNIFISHASEDKRISFDIACDLKQSNYNVWYDEWNLLLGHSIPDNINMGLDSADALIIILSQNYLESAFCKDEWQGFYMKYNKLNRPIIVIIIDDSESPTILSSRKYFRLSDPYYYDNMLIDLKRSLKQLLT